MVVVGEFLIFFTCDMLGYLQVTGRAIRGMVKTLQDSHSNAFSHIELEKIQDDFLTTKRSEKTRKAYRVDLQQFWESADITLQSFGDFLSVPCADITGLVKQFLEEQEKREYDLGHVTNFNTVNRKHFTLISFFKYLRNAYQYPSNPAELIPTLPKQESSNTPIFSWSEFQEMSRYMARRRWRGKAQYRDYLIILGLFHFALREAELTHLRWDSIHTSPLRHLQLLQKRNRLKFLPIPPKYWRQLQTFADKYGRHFDFIFHPVKNNTTNTFNKPISCSYVYWLTGEVGKKALGRNDIIPHSFRASFITMARENRQDDKEIMRATGITRSRTLNYYDLRERLEANAINFFGKQME